MKKPKVKAQMAVIVEITEENGLITVKTYHLADEALSRDDDESEGDWLSESVGAIDERFEQSVKAMTIRKLLQAAPLTQKEQAILRLTFWDEADDAAIAKILHLSPSRVRTLRRIAIRKLRHLASQWGLL